MRKLFTLILGILLVGGVFAQKPEGVIKKATVAPVLDGEIDDVWAEANEYFIDKNFQLEIPTLPTANPQTETSWKGLWTAEGMYVLLKVTDDAYYPNYVAGTGLNDYDYDKTEIYFDVNYEKVDGLGTSAGANGNKGHYQFAPSFTAANTDGTLMEPTGFKYAIKVTEPNYVQEYFVPFSQLKDLDGMAIDIEGEVGFDVTIIDRETGDAARKRSVWANVGAITESWANMDDCGIITFEGAEKVEVSAVTLTGGSITADNQTLQIGNVIVPEDATIKALKWTIETKEGSTGRATISATGLVTPITDGVFLVKASTTDGSFIDAEPVEVTITGQVATMFELSYLKNGEFNNTTATGAPVDWSNGTVADGVLTFGPDSVLTNQWDYSLLQTTYVPYELKDEPFILSFKAWADEERTLPLIFEDATNDGAQWDAYATSTDPGWSDKSWTVNLTTEPTVYTLHLNFGPMQTTTQQNFNFQVGLHAAKVHLDSIYLISEADMALVPVIDQKLESFKIYPNPADTQLHISLNTENTRVAIYNSVGVKMEEVVVPGTQHTFDVSRYTKGLYIVKANNSVMKFVK